MKVDAVFVCVLDEMHEEVVRGISGLGVSVCVEKPLSTSLESCVRMFRALKFGGEQEEGERKEKVFGICHVLRYSPHNMMLRHLVLDEGVIGDVLSLEHVEVSAGLRRAHRTFTDCAHHSPLVGGISVTLM